MIEYFSGGSIIRLQRKLQRHHSAGMVSNLPTRQLQLEALDHSAPPSYIVRMTRISVNPPLEIKVESVFKASFCAVSSTPERYEWPTWVGGQDIKIWDRKLLHRSCLEAIRRERFDLNAGSPWDPRPVTSIYLFPLRPDAQLENSGTLKTLISSLNDSTVSWLTTTIAQAIPHAYLCPAPAHERHACGTQPFMHPMKHFCQTPTEPMRMRNPG